MDDRGGGDFVAAFCSWRHRLCSAKPQREALRIALQELDGIFEKKLFDSPPQCPLEELDARLQRELELLEVDAKGQCSRIAQATGMTNAVCSPFRLVL